MIKNALYVIGTVFIALGLLGFVNNPILGLFEVDIVHNIVHLLTGVLALIFASTNASQARGFLLALAGVYGLVTILGFLQGEGELLGIMHVNTADNFLHLLLTITFLAIGLRGSTAMTHNPV